MRYFYWFGVMDVVSLIGFVIKIGNWNIDTGLAPSP